MTRVARTGRTAARGRALAGFTLIELVLVMVLTGLLAGMFTGLVLRPMQAQVDVGRRAALVDGATTALGRIARDVRAALPNSLRVSGDGRALELLRSSDGARYRSGAGLNPGGVDHSAASDWLDFASGDDSLNLLGRFTRLSFAYGVPLPAGTRLAIYPSDASTWADAASGADPGVITPATLSITIEDDADEDQLRLSSSFRFRYASPRQRVFAVEGPVSYLCSAGGGTLYRVDGYAPTALQPENPLGAPLAGGRVAALADDLASCEFRYEPGTASRAGLVSLGLHLRRGDEQVRLLQQVHVEAVP